MSTCEYKYSLQDNLEATKQLMKIKNKRKTNIVTLFVILVSVFGIMVTINAIVNKDGNWGIGVMSIALLAAYFLVEKVGIYFQLKKQKEFYLSSDLKNVTKVKVEMKDNQISETFYINENVHGVNNYTIDELTTIKFDKDNMFLIFNNSTIIMLKNAAMTQKSLQNFTNLKEKFKKSTK